MAERETILRMVQAPFRWHGGGMIPLPVAFLGGAPNRKALPPLPSYRFIGACATGHQRMGDKSVTRSSAGGRRLACAQYRSQASRRDVEHRGLARGGRYAPLRPPRIRAAGGAAVASAPHRGGPRRRHSLPQRARRPTPTGTGEAEAPVQRIGSASRLVSRWLGRLTPGRTKLIETRSEVDAWVPGQGRAGRRV